MSSVLRLTSDRLLPLALAAAVVGLLACKKSAPPADRGAGSAAGSAAGAAPDRAAAPDPAQIEGQKLEAAITCLNSHTERVFEVRAGYLSDVDPATGMPVRNTTINLMGLGSSEACERGIKAAAALTPAAPDLDRASAGYVAALAAFRAEWEALDAYYKKGGFTDDQGAGARALHPKVMAALDRFAAANRALHGAVGERNRQRHLAELKVREQRDGRNLEVIIGTLMLEAQTLLSHTDGPTPDATALAAQLTTYGALVDELDAYVSGHADEAARWGSLANIRNYSKAVLAAAKTVARDGSGRDEVVRQYNFLVDNVNRH
jgi:hypothetical protein